MITADRFLAHLRSRGVDFFCGVPDSLLKGFCACLTETESGNHVITTVGSMGHSIMIALGIAREFTYQHKTDTYVVCLDGDGAALMQMGNQAIAAAAHCPNLLHIVLNNAAHDSVGGQPTVGGEVDFCKVAEGLGYYVGGSFSGDSASDLHDLLRERIDQMIYSWACDDEWQTTFLEVKVAKGARKDLGRPKELPQVNKKLFMETLAHG